MIRSNIKTLRLAGVGKMLEGVTTPEEILRVTVGD
jgi:type II secretory ATPase GspE/PulE/Tfp pilus assembly ATPase PilB-like protein